MVETGNYLCSCARRAARTFGFVLTLAGVLAGCGSTVVKTVTTSGPTTSPTQTTTTGPQQAKAGDTLTLTGNGGERMDVTVNGIMDPMTVGELDQPRSGQRFVGVQITLKNVGSASYSDAPANGATLISNTNEQAKRQIVSGGPCSTGFASSANIAPGDSQQGCLPFEMPVGQDLAKFQFTLSSGFAGRTGQWSLVGAPRIVAGTSGADTHIGTTPSPSGNTTPPPSGSIGSLPNQCSPGLAATHGVSCGLADNFFYKYYRATQSGGDTTSISAWSPATQQYYRGQCSSANGVITCAVSGTTNPNAQVKFTQAALDAYSPAQADSYARKHDIGPYG